MSALPTPDRLFQAMDQTWAPAEMPILGPWVMRRGLGGGKRVSAATTNQLVTCSDILAASHAMAEWNQPAIFMLREENRGLDKMLADEGYQLVDPVLVFASPAEIVAAVDPKPLAAIPCDEPLALMAEFWNTVDISPARMDVMNRTGGPKTYLFSRFQDSPAGAAFAAVDDEIVMLHALAVSPEFRRAGVARDVLGRAAIWGMENGAKFISTVTTGENLPAQRLFSGLGMQVVSKYHYRMK